MSDEKLLEMILERIESKQDFVRRLIINLDTEQYWEVNKLKLLLAMLLVENPKPNQPQSK